MSTGSSAGTERWCGFSSAPGCPRTVSYTHLAMREPVTVIGAGLAGCEAAWQLAQAGIPVVLREMKPRKKTPAHHADLFGELVCSNSLRSDQLENAVGLLKDCLLYTS